MTTTTPRTHGGARKGSGRKPSTTPTIGLHVRVPLDVAAYLQRIAAERGTTAVNVARQLLTAAEIDSRIL